MYEVMNDSFLIKVTILTEHGDEGKLQVSGSL